MTIPLAYELLDRVRIGLEMEDLPVGVRSAFDIDDGDGLIVMRLVIDGTSVCESYEAVEFLRTDAAEAGGMKALARRHVGNLMAELDEYFQGL